MNSLTALRELSFPSTRIQNVMVSDDGRRLEVLFEKPSSLPGEDGISFDSVRAYRYRAESHCSEWHVNAYDTLTEVEDSEWLAELLDDTPDDMRDMFEMHHFMIYLDSAGCYEVAAKSWRFLGEPPMKGEA